MKCPSCGSELVDVCDCCERWRCFGNCGKHLTDKEAEKALKEEMRK